jgi:hypothetical protein
MTNSDNNQNDDTQNTPKAWSDDKLNRQAEGEFLSEYLINKFSVATAEHSKKAWLIIFKLKQNLDYRYLF